MGLGDEGGFAPQIDHPEDVLRLLVRAIEGAGYRPGRDGSPSHSTRHRASLSMTVSTWWAGESLTSGDMIARYEAMIDETPIWSLEEGLGRERLDGYVEDDRAAGGPCAAGGDDCLVDQSGDHGGSTIGRKAGNGHADQGEPDRHCGRTLEAVAVCREAGWAQMLSHRSGEPEDAFIADLAVRNWLWTDQERCSGVVSVSPSTTGSSGSRRPVNSLGLTK